MMTKRLVAFALALVLGFGIAAPKAHADDEVVALTMMSGGLCVFGTGVAAVILMDDPDFSTTKWLIGVPLMAGGLGLGIWGAIKYVDAKAVSKIENDPVLKHVRFDVTGTGLVLGGHFTW